MQSLDVKNQLMYLINNSDDTSLRSILHSLFKKELYTIRKKHLSGKTPSLSLEELRQKFTKQYGISLES